MPSAPAIRLELRASLAQRAITVGIVFAAVIALFIAQWPFAWRIAAIALLVSAALTVSLRQRWAARIDAIEWRADDDWWLKDTRSPNYRKVTLRDSRVVGPVIALHFDDAGGQRKRLTVNLWSDSADRDQLRRLRIRLARLTDRAGNAPGSSAVH